MMEDMMDKWVGERKRERERLMIIFTFTQDPEEI